MMCQLVHLSPDKHTTDQMHDDPLANTFRDVQRREDTFIPELLLLVCVQ